MKKLLLIFSHEGGIYNKTVLKWAFIEAGGITTVGCLIGFFVSLSLSNIPYTYFYYSSQKYFQFGAPDIISTSGEALDDKDQLSILYKAQSTYFLGLVFCQFCNMLCCRRKYTFFNTNLLNNYPLLFASFGGIIITVLVVYTEFFEDILVIRRPSLLSLTIPIGAGVLILILDTLKKLK